MSYQEFLNTLISPIRLFVSALSQVADSLIHNYIFITLLGLSLFISLVWLIYYTFHNFINSKIDRIESKMEKYKNYELYKEVQKEYLNKHRNDEFDYLYDLTLLRQQVLNGVYRNHPEVLIDNLKQYNKLKIQALKSIENDNYNDKNPFNDDDINYVVPNPKIQKADRSELIESLNKYTPLSKEELSNYSKQLESDINNDILRIMNNNKDLLSKNGLVYDSKTNKIYSNKTGELI